ncbi:MAG: metallophosphoesterase [Deltaproteobacteria bacterium]
MYSILHISDLHRSPEDPISNDELISSLRADRHRYIQENSAIQPPDAIVVSGDIIQGVPLNNANYSTELRMQYDVAENFLSRLCEEFLGGDRSKVILVPGNHDVDLNTSLTAMTVIEPENEPPLKAAFNEESSFRWSWKNKCFYKIVDQVQYEKRMDSYLDFAERFYSVNSGSFRFSRERDFNIYRLCDNRIGVAAFNSCNGNDCFASHGAIKRGAIASSHLELGSSCDLFELWLAVWHHSIEGPPYRTDYMNIDHVRNMIGRGFRLGLYGHQHRVSAEPRHILLPDRETMAVVSTGSLCAGPKELPSGTNRQYNIIELADDLQSARVHVRQMAIAQIFSQAHLNAVGGQSYVDLNWEMPGEIAAKLASDKRSHHNKVILEAERLLKSQKYSNAISILEPLMVSLEGYGRMIFFDAAVHARRWDLVIKFSQIPQSIQELINLVEACDQNFEIQAGREALLQYAVPLKMPEAMIEELQRRLNIRETQIK